MIEKYIQVDHDERDEREFGSSGLWRGILFPSSATAINLKLLFSSRFQSSFLFLLVVKDLSQ